MARPRRPVGDSPIEESILGTLSPRISLVSDLNTPEVRTADALMVKTQVVCALRGERPHYAANTVTLMR